MIDDYPQHMAATMYLIAPSNHPSTCLENSGPEISSDTPGDCRWQGD